MGLGHSSVATDRKVLQDNDLKPNLMFINGIGLDIDSTVTDKTIETFEAVPEVQRIVENNMVGASLAALHSDLTCEVVF